MAKKLKSELELENSKAKRAAAEVGESAKKSFDAAATAVNRHVRSVSEAARQSFERMASTAKEQMDGVGEGTAKLLASAAASADKMAGSFSVSSKTLLRVAGSFGGMLAGTAVRAIALKQPEGSTAQKALDYGGGALQGAGQGAMMGSMFGPLGTAIGALAGAANAIANKLLGEAEAEKRKQEELEKTNAANREFVEGMLEAQSRTSSFRSMIENLGDTERSLSERQAEVAAEIQKRIDEEERLKRGLKLNSGKFADEEDQKLFRKQVKDYQTNHAELERLQQVQKTLDKNTDGGRDRASLDAVDALARVGGNFAGGDTGFRDLQRTNEQQLKVLEKIEQKTTGKTNSGTF